MTKISVILPVYNGGHLLKDSINSVLNQDIKDYEFIICDDCSTDNSYEFINELCLNKTNVKVLRNRENLGLFKTLNKLINQSSASLIHLWSQDDIMKSNCLSSTLNFHKKHPEIGMSYSGRDLIDENGDLISFTKNDGTPEIITRERYALTSCYWGCIAGNIANVTLVKTILDQIGNFNEDLKVSGDFELWTRIITTTPIGFNKDANILLRVHQGQLSNQYSSMLYRMQEDIPIMKLLLNMVSAEDKKKTQRCWRWKTQTMYFNEIVFLVRNKQWGLAKQGIKVLNKVSFMPLLFLRWTIIKLLRLMKLEIWFYRNVLNTLK